MSELLVKCAVKLIAAVVKFRVINTCKKFCLLYVVRTFMRFLSCLNDSHWFSNFYATVRVIGEQAVYNTASWMPASRQEAGLKFRVVGEVLNPKLIRSQAYTIFSSPKKFGLS
jgi:hypothetical protein